MNQDIEHQKIEIFRELSILGQKELLTKFMERVSAHVASSSLWTPVEINSRDYGGNTNCFMCSETQEHPAAKIWFAHSSREEKMYVSNIVPVEMKKLTKAQYNTILVEFYETFIRPLKLHTRLEVRLEDDLVGLDHWIDQEAIRLLNAFSNLANKGTGTGHPMDERRWWLFCFYIHSKGYFPDFYPDILMRWLHEVLGWHEEAANELGIEYERTLRVLAKYDVYRDYGTLP